MKKIMKNKVNKLNLAQFTFLIFIILLILAGISIGAIFASFTRIDIEKAIKNKELSIPTNIFDRNGKLIAQIYVEHREIIPLKDLPQDLINAFLAYEDKNFYEHHGFNLKRLIGAMISNIKRALFRHHQGYVSGASTITQQLAKRLFTEGEKTIFRKLKELWYAVQIEKHFSKNEILELYLNEIYFGHGAYGIQTASKLYFNKDARELTLGECAILAMLPQSPYRHSPILFPKTAQKRQKMVLDRMVEAGFITKEQATVAYNNFWAKYKQKKFSTGYSSYSFAMSVNKAPYYVDAVLRILFKDFTPAQIYKKGLNVYTAVDIDYQQAARKILQESLKSLNENYKKNLEYLNKYLLNDIPDFIDIAFQTNNIYSNLGSYKQQMKFNKFYLENIVDTLHLSTTVLNTPILSYEIEDKKNKFIQSLKTKIIEGSIVSIDPKTGYVLTLIGGSGFNLQNQFNRAIKGHFQPGSGIKPFIYTAAFNEKLITPSTTILDAPIIYNFDDGTSWEPHNYSGKYHGYIRVREALRKSINIPAVKVFEYLGIEKGRTYLSEFYGINRNRIKPYLSTALGTIEVTPLEVARGFATLANYGKAVFPIIVRYVTDREGKILKNYEKQINDKLLNYSDDELQVVAPQAAFLTTSVLEDTAKPGGTAYWGLRPFNLKFPFASKTGTTSNWNSAWFQGYTPNLATVVWVGFDRTSSLGKGFTGGRVSAPIWGKFMKYVYEILKRKVENFPIPPNIIKLRVDSESGLLASSKSKSTYYEYFWQGTQPKTLANGYNHFVFLQNNENNSEDYNIFNNSKDNSKDNELLDIFNFENTNNDIVSPENQEENNSSKNTEENSSDTNIKNTNDQNSANQTNNDTSTKDNSKDNSNTEEQQNSQTEDNTSNQ